MAISTNFPNVRPSLLLDFANSQQLDPRVTFSRSTTGTYYNFSGVLTTAAINEARFDFNPTTGESLGLLIEQSSTNFCLQSTNISFTPTWTGDTSGGSVPTVTGNYATAPDGTTTATRIQLNRGAGTFSRWQQVISGVTSSIYTGSVWMKTTSGTGTANVGLRIDATGVNCVVTGQWQRFSLATSASSITPNIQILSFTSISGTDVSADILVWGSQVEAGSFFTSFIPTTTAQVTRAVDNASMTGTNFSSWYNATQGTVYVEGSGAEITSGNRNFYTISDNTGSNRMLSAFGNSYNFFVVNGGVAQATLTNGTDVANVSSKNAGVYQQDNFLCCKNGAAVSNDLSGTIPTVNRIYIGASADGTGAYLNGRIKKISYYPQALTSAQLQALTGS